MMPLGAQSSKLKRDLQILIHSRMLNLNLWCHVSRQLTDLVFFMTKSGDEEEKILKVNFTWQKHFLGTYKSENVTTRKRYLLRLSICSQLFHTQDMDFLYPFQMYNSAIINQYGSDVLMEHFNSWGISANPDTFRLFRSEVAQNQKDELLKGEIHNLEKKVFGVAHIDNREFLKGREIELNCPLHWNNTSTAD